MINQQKEKITQMRSEGFSYSKIAEVLSISENTVKSFCRRNNLGGVSAGTDNQADGALCPQCGILLTHSAGAKHKRFCSNKCRMKWWNAHPEAVRRKAIYTFTCPTCNREFASYGNKNRKYCSRSCYGKAKAVRYV